MHIVRQFVDCCIQNLKKASFFKIVLAQLHVVNFFLVQSSFLSFKIVTFKVTRDVYLHNPAICKLWPILDDQNPVVNLAQAGDLVKVWLDSQWPLHLAPHNQLLMLCHRLTHIFYVVSLFLKDGPSIQNNPLTTLINLLLSKVIMLFWLQLLVQVLMVLIHMRIIEHFQVTVTPDGSLDVELLYVPFFLTFNLLGC